MKRIDLQAFIIVIGITIMLMAGCGPQEPSSIKKSRIIAAENIELRKELERLSKEFEILKKHHYIEINKQKDLLQTCLQEKEALKKKSRQNIRNQVKGVLDTVLEENKKLREENTRLNTQIEELQKQPQ